MRQNRNGPRALAASGVVMAVALAVSTLSDRSMASDGSPSSDAPAPRSTLVERYRDEKVPEGARELEQRRADGAADPERDFRIACASLRLLVADGLGRGASADARRRALESIGLLKGEAELRAAGRVLGGEAGRPDHVASDPEVRRAYFHALSRDEEYGQPALVELAVRADDPIRQRALDALRLPETLSPAAQRAIARQLDAGRELFVNRAAMIAGAHGTSILIPSLVAAQYDPPTPTRGDEAWIAIGKTVSYVQGAVPVVGDASGAFQPIIGNVFEGSVLRIMESVVEIYRTEASAALAAIVERETGLPAPPFGFDEDRWLAWYERDFPLLASRHAHDVAMRGHESRVRIEGTRDDL